MKWHFIQIPGYKQMMVLALASILSYKVVATGAVSEQGGLGGMRDRRYSPWCPDNDDNNMAPGFGISKMNGGEVSCLTSAHSCLYLFIGAGHHL